MSNEVPDLISRRIFTFGGLAAGTVAAVGGTTSFSEDAEAQVVRANNLILEKKFEEYRPRLAEDFKTLLRLAGKQGAVLIDARHPAHGESAMEIKVPKGIKIVKVEHDQDMGSIEKGEKELMAALRLSEGKPVFFACMGNVRASNLARHLVTTRPDLLKEEQVITLASGLANNSELLVERKEDISENQGEDWREKALARN